MSRFPLILLSMCACFISFPSYASFGEFSQGHSVFVGAIAALALLQVVQYSLTRSGVLLLAALASIVSVLLLSLPLAGIFLWVVALFAFSLTLAANVALYKKKKLTGEVHVTAIAVLILLCVLMLTSVVSIVDVRWIVIANLFTGILVLYYLAARSSYDSKRLTELERSLERKLFEAGHDVNTALPNRFMLQQTTQMLIQKRQIPALSLLIIKVQNFEKINQVLGHANGDILITQLAERLKSLLKKESRVATFETDGEIDVNIACIGGVDFAVVIDSTDKTHLAEQIYHKLVLALKEPMVLQSCTLDFEFAGGIANYPEHGQTVENLISHAYSALDMQSNKDVVSVQTDHAKIYNPTNEFYTSERLALMADLREAIENNKLNLFVQPQIDLNTKTIVGGEIFIRWHHPIKGLIAPNDFIELAEQTGVIFPLTQWIIGQAAEALATINQVCSGYRMSINIGNSDVLHEEIIDAIDESCTKHGVSVTQIAVEIKEAALLTHPEKAKNTIVRMHSKGIRVAIDDFGTGYSSLAYINALPIDEVKIDCSFVSDLSVSSGNVKSNSGITGAIIDIARNLQLDVLAEGVESQEVCEKLTQMGCTLGQGYHFSRPFELAGFDSWIKQWNKKKEEGSLEL